jgi:hypothetical protein
MPCRIVDQPDGGMQVYFLIEPEAANRIRNKAYLMPADRYIWENVLKQAISGAAY